ncbi:hypothetical protein THRCLA_02657 [Thraustotheca clavata]|uniref:Transmembrane protein n=1 Tax=Thraustotheca clavata TaxID=74557 RepID=A0A1W0A4P4_9STRA|nr:hypothetical protein THRCLA_02657 [Thraustotheca clavata]
MSESIQLSEKGPSDKMVVQPVDTPPNMPYFHCQGSKYAFQWDTSPNHEKLMVVTSEPFQHQHEYYFCQSCCDNWDKNQFNMKWNLREFDGKLKNVLETWDFTHEARLQCYKTFITNTKEYFLTMLFILLCFPVFVIIPSTFLRDMNKKASELWEAVPKVQTFVSFVAVYATYIMIALSYPFKPQVLFWAFLELYTVLMYCLNILIHTPINGFINVYDRRFRRTTYGLCANILWVTCYGIVFPSFVLQNILTLIEKLPRSRIIASSAAKNTIDVKKLHFVDIKTNEPLPSNLLPGAFLSLQSHNYAKKKIDFTYTWATRLAFVYMVFCYSLFSSWVTGLFGHIEFAFPSAYALISSLNPEYNITGYAPGQMCHTVPGTNGTQWRTLFNMIVDPMPTTALGIPHLTLELYSNSTPLTYMIDNAWNINIAKQNGDNVTLIPIDGQNTFSFLATFHNVSNCSTITDNMTIQRNISYPKLSIQQYLRMNKGEEDSTLRFILFTMNLCQLAMIIAYILNSTEPLWDLWLHFDGITEIGLYSTSFTNSSTMINLGNISNLCTWWQLRNAIITTSQELTYFIKIIISLSLLHCAISLGGLLYYCIMGIAPMPTYFLLMIALAQSLAILIFLYPITKVVQIQASHGDMLRDVLTRQLVEKAHSSDPLDTKLEKYLTKFIDIIDNHDDRICFWGVEMSQERLKGLCVTLVSGISFITSKIIQFSWSDKNAFYG